MNPNFQRYAQQLGFLTGQAITYDKLTPEEVATAIAALISSTHFAHQKFTEQALGILEGAVSTVKRHG